LKILAKPRNRLRNTAVSGERDVLSMTKRALLLASFTLMLAACEGDAGTSAEQKPADDRGADGEVLGGTVSDAMIPYEDLQSTSPTAGGGSSSSSDDDKDD
jgi:hypothetical protein